MPTKKAPTSTSFAIVGSNDPSIKGEYPTIVDNDPGFST
jgi:hypothetical protein